MTKKCNIIEKLLFLRPSILVDEDPRLLSDWKRGITLSCVTLTVSTSSITSTIYFPGIPYIASELNAAPMPITLTTALYILVTGIAPVFWASISDHYHIRRVLIMVALIIFSFSSMISAIVDNIWALIVLRCIQGAGASCALSIGPGVIADCYPIEKRGTAFAKFYYGVFVGPLIGPVVGGGLIMTKQTWRATFWFLFAYGITILILVFFALPETYRDNERFDKEVQEQSLQKAHDDEEKGKIEDIKEGDNKEEKNYMQDDDVCSMDPGTTVINVDQNDGEQNNTKDKIETVRSARANSKRINPIEPFLMLRHPFVLLASMISGISFGAMYAIETIMPSLYQTHYNFVAWQTGLTFIGAGIGNTIGTIVNGLLADRLLLRSRKKRSGIPKVEDRLTLNLWPSGIIFIPLGLLLFGWPIVYDMSVWAPIMGFSIQNFGMVQLMTLSSAYLVDAMPGKGASAAASSNVMRNVMACFLTLSANPMTDAMGAGWTTVLLSTVTLLSVAFLLILKVYGEELRRRSGY
ncbi:major facilitator superfamily domain-containing protein [Phascolomyces articulosus]|uniref:Major facilitator superfamily domain-containing protein n=1 Tax=Phascolomyces articulosus TaxID=60185 RepID=A0AAD5PBM5_9FUNG|nr:major facilitator superfamily domain-containing protein [Phascolomyces articulosus]